MPLTGQLAAASDEDATRFSGLTYCEPKPKSASLSRVPRISWHRSLPAPAEIAASRLRNADAVLLMLARRSDQLDVNGVRYHELTPIRHLGFFEQVGTNGSSTRRSFPTASGTTTAAHESRVESERGFSEREAQSGSERVRIGAQAIKKQSAPGVVANDAQEAFLWKSKVFYSDAGTTPDYDSTNETVQSHDAVMALFLMPRPLLPRGCDTVASGCATLAAAHSQPGIVHAGWGELYATRVDSDLRLHPFVHGVEMKWERLKAVREGSGSQQAESRAIDRRDFAIAGHQQLAVISREDANLLPEIRVKPVGGYEEDASMEVKVSLSEEAFEDVTVNYRVKSETEDTATEEADYAPIESDSIVIPAGFEEGTIEISLIDDSSVEAAETFTFTLTGAINATLPADRSIRMRIGDDDAAGLLVIAPTELELHEGDSLGKSFNIRLSNQPPADLEVIVAAVPTAQLSTDLGLHGAFLTFETQDWHTNQTVRVWASHDDDAADEIGQLKVLVSRGRPKHFVNLQIIDDDEGALKVDPAMLEIDEGDTVGKNFEVQLAVQPTTEVTVTITGNSSTDVRLSVSTLTFTTQDWAEEQQVTVTAVDDPDATDDAVTLDLVARGGGYDSLAASVTVNVIDDDPGLSINDVVVQENDAQAAFTVQLDKVADRPVMVQYATVDGTAIAGVDYHPTLDVLRIPPGKLSGQVMVRLIDDNDAESDETFTVVLTNPMGAALADNVAVGTIRDDDAHQLSVNDVTVVESAGAASFVISLDRPSMSQVISVQYATRDGTATAPADYEAQMRTIQFAPGVAAQIVELQIVDDAEREGSEEFSLVLGSAVNAEIADAEGTGTILDDEAAPSLSIEDVVVSEDAGRALFTVALSEQSGAQVTVDYVTEDETARAGEDYVMTSGRLEFSPGLVEMKIAVPIVQDEEDEEDETFLVLLGGAQNADVADGKGQGTITDDDEAITVSIYDGRAMEDAGVLHLPVRLSRASLLTVSVMFATSDATAEAGADYSASRGIVIFESGSREGVVAVVMQDDEIEEGDEEFEVTLSGVRNAVVSRETATGTIVDNDGMPRLRVGDITASEEGGEAIFRVTLSAPSARTVTATFRTLDGTAVAGVDYEMASGLLEFAPAELEKEVRVKLFRDARDWRAETFMLALDAASNARLADAVATATIVEEESLEEGVLAAFVARFMRTSTSHVVDTILERLRWLEHYPSCVPAVGEDMATLRYGSPTWDPSAGELLAGCGLAATSGAMSVWGRGEFARLSGKERELSLNADVTTASLGADYRWKRGLMAGLLFSHSQATGTFDAYEAAGTTRARLTGAYPYVSYGIVSNYFWALTGLGRGTTEVARADVSEADLNSRLVAAGAVGTLASRRSIRLSYEMDAFMVRGSAKGDVAVHRVRAGLQSSVLLTRSLRPYLEAAIRRDGGDAETGLGLELGGGLRLAHLSGRLQAAVRGRGLVTHTDGGIAEWGMAAAMRFGASHGLGPAVEVRPVWGPAQSGGMRALWGRDSVVDAALGVPGQRRIEVRFGYGTLLKKENGVARPVLAVALRNTGRDYRIGYEITMMNGLAVSAAVVSHESAHPWQPVNYGLTAHAALDW